MNTLGSLSTAVMVLDRARMSAAPNTAFSHQTTTGAARLLSSAGSPASIFSVNHVDANTMKVDLMQRFGKAFGLDMDDFADAGAMARVIREAVTKMTPQAMQAIEKAVGLDKLGVSLLDMLDAMSNPGGDADRKLTAVLRAQAGETDLDGAEGAATRGFGLDEIGRYSSASLVG